MNATNRPAKAPAREWASLSRAERERAIRLEMDEDKPTPRAYGSDMSKLPDHVVMALCGVPQ